MKKILLTTLLFIASMQISNAYTWVKTGSGTVYRGVTLSDSNMVIKMKSFEGISYTFPLDSNIETKEILTNLVTDYGKEYLGYIENFDSLYVYYRQEDGKKFKILYGKIRSFNNTFADRFLGKHSEAYAEQVYEDESGDKVPSYFFLLGLSGLSPGTFNAIVGATIYFFHARFALGVLEINNSRGFQMDLGLCFYKTEHSSHYVNVSFGKANLLLSANLSAAKDALGFEAITYSAIFHGFFIEAGMCGAEGLSSSTPYLQIGFLYQTKN